MVEVTKDMLAQAALKAARDLRVAGKPNEALKSYRQAIEGYGQASKAYSNQGKVNDAGYTERQKAKIAIELKKYKEEIGATKTGRYAKVA